MAAEEKLSGQLGLWDAISIIVGIVIGTTIFELPWLVFMNTPNPWMALAVWVFGGFLAFVGGLCYAELASTYPKAGGDYYYLTEAFGRWVGFLFGWAQLIVILPASIGVMAYVFASRMTQIHPLNDEELLKLNLNSEFYYAALAILVVTILNLIGVTLGKLAQNILAIAKVAGILAIMGIGFAGAQPGLTDWSAPAEAAQWGWGSLALIIVLYAFGGWNDAAFVAAEVREPQKNIPWALLGGIGAITVIYLLVNLAYILGLGFDKVKQFGSLPVQLVEGQLGENAARVISIIVMLSAMGAVNGLIFTGSRVYATLGTDHRLFGFLGHWRPNAGSPIFALIVQALITLGMVFLFGSENGHSVVNQGLNGLNELLTKVVSTFNENWEVKIDYPQNWSPKDAFDALVSHSAPAFWVFFLLAGFSLFSLREKNRSMIRPFSVPFYPLTPIIFCNSCVFMLYSSVTYIGWRTLFVVALLLIGIPLYWLSEMLGRPTKPGDSTPTVKLPATDVKYRR